MGSYEVSYESFMSTYYKALSSANDKIMIIENISISYVNNKYKYRSHMLTEGKPTEIVSGRIQRVWFFVNISNLHLTC